MAVNKVSVGKDDKPTMTRLYTDTWFVEKKGAFIMPTLLELEQEIKSMEVKPGDVWIVTNPKSGTTWMQEMVWLLTHNLDYEGAKALLKYRSPGLDGCWTHKYFGQPTVPLREFERLASLSGGRRVLKTHLHYDFLPQKLHEQNSSAKIIFVARNPKDVCVSHFYFQALLGNGYPVNTLEKFCDFFMKGTHYGGPYWKQVKEFWNKRNDPNILFIKYEDMKKDLESVVKEVATFLEEPIPNGEPMRKLLDHLSFKSMRNNPALNRQAGEDTLRSDALSEDGHFIRRGIVGGHKEKLTAETIKKFDAWIEENTTDTDLTFEHSI